MGITSITSIINKSDETVHIVKREDPRGDNVTLAPYDNSSEVIWIPWVENQQDFENKTIEITYSSNNRKTFLWQTGDKIRYSKNSYKYPGDAVEGSSEVDGLKKLVIEKNTISLIKI